MEFSPEELQTIKTALKWAIQDYHRICLNSPEGSTHEGKKFKVLEAEARDILRVIQERHG